MISSFSSQNNKSVSLENAQTMLHQIKEQLIMFQKDPEFQEIQDSAGTFCMEIASCEFLAACDWHRKCIILDPRLFEKRVGEIYPRALESLLFELTNLAKHKEFESLINNASIISPNEFVESYEALEHNNILTIKKILRRCLPEDHWPDYQAVDAIDQFYPHYLMQQTGGHSERIWERYQHLFPAESSYISVTPPSQDEQKYIMALLDLQSRQDTENYDLVKTYILEKAKEDESFCRLEKYYLPLIESKSVQQISPSTN